MSSQASLSTSFRTGLAAARANLVPGLALQAIALAVVLCYYFYPPVTHALSQLSAFKSRTGLIFGLVSTGLCGGVIPFVYLRLVSDPSHRPTAAMGLLLTAFWAYKGIEVELWYRLLGAVWGNEPTVTTVLIKSICDQFIYCPILAIPLTVVVYSWGETGFMTSALIDDMKAGGWYGRRVLTPLVSNLSVWLPAVTIIYALPTPLQLPMQNLVLVFFTLMLAHLMRRHKGPTA